MPYIGTRPERPTKSKGEVLKEEIALSAAFDLCFDISDAMGNIIAASEPPEKADIDMKKKADIFIKWYKKRK